MSGRVQAMSVVNSSIPAYVISIWLVCNEEVNLQAVYRDQHAESDQSAEEI